MISNIKYTTIYSKIWPKSGRGVFRTLLNVRSSRLEVFRKKDVLRNFAKFTGKQLRQSLSFNKVAGLRPATLLKKRKRLRHRCFPVDFPKFLRTPSLQNTPGGCF